MGYSREFFKWGIPGTIFSGIFPGIPGNHREFPISIQFKDQSFPDFNVWLRSSKSQVSLTLLRVSINVCIQQYRATMTRYISRQITRSGGFKSCSFWLSGMLWYLDIKDKSVQVMYGRVGLNFQPRNIGGVPGSGVPTDDPQYPSHTNVGVTWAILYSHAKRVVLPFVLVPHSELTCTWTVHWSLVNSNQTVWLTWWIRLL